MTHPEPSTSGARPTPREPSLYLNRELSWLAFNRRVLDEVADPHWPLLERLKFLAITFSNLDEFFMIRVSGLHEQLEAGARRSAAPTASPRAQQLARIREIVRRLLKDAADAARAAAAPRRSPSTASGSATGRASATPTQERGPPYFRESVFPVLTPLAVDPGHPFPFISNLSLSLAVEARDPETRRAPVRPGEGAGDPPPLRAARAVRARRRDDARPGRVPSPRGAHRGQPRRALPGHADPRRVPVPRSPGTWTWTSWRRKPTTSWSPSTGRSAAGSSARCVRLEVHPDTPQRIREFLLLESWRSRRTTSTRSPASSGPRR